MNVSLKKKKDIFALAKCKMLVFAVALEISKAERLSELKK